MTCTDHSKLISKIFTVRGDREKGNSPPAALFTHTYLFTFASGLYSKLNGFATDQIETRAH